MLDFFKKEEKINLVDQMTISHDEKRNLFKIIINQSSDDEMQIQFKSDWRNIDEIKKIIRIQEYLKNNPDTAREFEDIDDWIEFKHYWMGIRCYLRDLYNKLNGIMFEPDIYRVRLINSMNQFDQHTKAIIANNNNDKKTLQKIEIARELIILLSKFFFNFFMLERSTEEKDKLINDLKHQLDTKLALLKL
ncbi:MAG: hypothetical protein ACD_58C00330G0010 [uncultured bacterium]|nr:MAG: hypothetical protein ACD_58C00330G0010 [uncultured bacterium]